MPAAPAPKRRSAPTAAILRRRIETAVDRLIAALDALDAPEEDLEEGHDREHDEAELSGIGDQEGLAEQVTGEPSLGATLDLDQCTAWGPDRAADADNAEASGTVDDLQVYKSAQAWQADRLAAETAHAQLQGIVNRKR